MTMLDWIDKHYRKLVVIAGFVALALYGVGWTGTSSALVVASLALMLINSLRLSRDSSRGKFPPNG